MHVGSYRVPNPLQVTNGEVTNSKVDRLALPDYIIAKQVRVSLAMPLPSI